MTPWINQNDLEIWYHYNIGVMDISNGYTIMTWILQIHKKNYIQGDVTQVGPRKRLINLKMTSKIVNTITMASQEKTVLAIQLRCDLKYFL